ncbi:MAG: S-layer protein [Rhodopirellula sp.]|nr:S-layer protein [Rhodopirellula sp.]
MLAVLLGGYACATETVLPDNGAALNADDSENQGDVQRTTSVSFELDVLPVLTAYGCNMGACHGKQRGQNGFQLSLLGFDPDFDFAALTRDARGRRLFLAAPQQSLLLQKSVALLPHGGGKRFDIGSDAYDVLLAWINQGAAREIKDEPKLDRVVLGRSDFSLLPEEQQELQVVAHYSDGSSRDVTKLATYLSNEAAVVAVSKHGQLTAGALPGETAIMARYMNHICVANVAIPRTVSISASVYEALPRNNFIDEQVYAKLQRLGIRPSEVVSDEIFLRRVHVDLIGRFPSANEARVFLESQDPEKRSKLVDALLERPEYVDHWSGYWADLLRPNPYRVGIKAVLNYDNWIRDQFRENVSYDRFVSRLVTAKGSTWQNGAATLYRDRRSPDEVATMVSQLFLGIRLECAKCHHHPFERWSQKDFYQFAAYFSKVTRKGTGLSPPISGGEEIVYISSKGQVKHPLTAEVLDPVPLYEVAKLATESSSNEVTTTKVNDEPVTTAPDDPRVALAEWMTSPGNGYFAQVQVNRLWGILMGRGFVEPVDDLRSTNPASNPELLDALADHFRASGFDLKSLLKTIVLSRVYSHSSVPSESNVTDRLNYSRNYRRRLRAEVLMDAVADVTETPAKLTGLPAESRANQVWTTRVDSVFLDTFGRPNENQDPPCERTPDSTVTQSLHLMNSRVLDGRIRDDSGRAARLAGSEMNSEQIADELYLAVFSRFPSEVERDYVLGLFKDVEKRRAVIEDLMWAMVNSPEFTIRN